MKTLEDVKAKFEPRSTNGDEVQFFAYIPKQTYSIIAMHQPQGQTDWFPVSYTDEGYISERHREHGNNLVLRKKHLPVDILCEVWNYPSEKYARYSDGHGGFFHSGKDSFSTVGSSTEWENYRIVTNPIRPWLGGECPIPEGCLYRIYIEGHWYECGTDRTLYFWQWTSDMGQNITAYQILGEADEI